MARIVAGGILLIAITAVLYSLPEKSSEWIGSRDLIRKLYLLPILLSAMWFGARGAASSTVFTTLACGVLAGSAWPAEVSSQVGQVGEVAVFWLVGALSASFFEQQKRFVGKIEVANDNTLVALASALDVREHNTGVHSLRVADYMLRLAREAGIREKEALEVFWRGALLHDVGKIGIPDKVLLKPGPLSPEEWVVMRNHPDVGAGMLRKIEFLRGPSEIVLSHHEWFDGTGYPRKLKGAQIPLGARLFAVIDVYDALTTDRAYHTARSTRTRSPRSGRRRIPISTPRSWPPSRRSPSRNCARSRKKAKRRCSSPRRRSRRCTRWRPSFPPGRDAITPPRGSTSAPRAGGGEHRPPCFHTAGRRLRRGGVSRSGGAETVPGSAADPREGNGSAARRDPRASGAPPARRELFGRSVRSRRVGSDAGDPQTGTGLIGGSYFRRAISIRFTLFTTARSFFTRSSLFSER